MPSQPQNYSSAENEKSRIPLLSAQADGPNESLTPSAASKVESSAFR